MGLVLGMCKPVVTGSSCHRQGEGLLGGEAAPKDGQEESLQSSAGIPVLRSLVPPTDTACRGNKRLWTEERGGFGVKSSQLNNWHRLGRGGTWRGAGQSECEVFSLKKPRCLCTSTASMWAPGPSVRPCPLLHQGKPLGSGLFYLLPLGVQRGRRFKGPAPGSKPMLLLSCLSGFQPR